MPDYRLVQFKNTPVWFIEWREAGKRRRQSTGQTDKRKAEQLLTAFARDFEREARKTGTLAEILTWYFDIHASNLPSATQADIAISHITGFMGSLTPTALGLEQQAEYINHRRASDIGSETINRELSVLSAALNKAVEWRRLDTAPKIKLLPKAPPRERYLTRPEAARLMWHLRKQKRARHLLLFTRLALHSGPRPHEITDLTWNRVDFENMAIWYFDPDMAQTTKRATVAGMTPYIARALKAAKKRSKTTHVIEHGGEPCQRIVRGFTRHAKAAGLEGVTPHTLRHTFATWAALGGAEMAKLRMALAHAKSSTTDRYVKYSPDAHMDVIRAARRKRSKRV